MRDDRAVLAMKRSPDLSAELADYREAAEAEGQDIPTAFEKKYAEMVASGKVRLSHSAASSGRTSGTLWDRLRSKRPPSA